MTGMMAPSSQPACPINLSLGVLGDAWSLLVVRDIVFYGKHTFTEFMASNEGIATNVLADRLAALQAAGILTRATDPRDRRRAFYALTDKGLDLIPILVELANWGTQHHDAVVPDPRWVHKAESDRDGLYDLIRETVRAGGAVWVGPDSVAEQLARVS